MDDASKFNTERDVHSCDLPYVNAEEGSRLE